MVDLAVAVKAEQQEVAAEEDKEKVVLQNQAAVSMVEAAPLVEAARLVEAASLEVEVVSAGEGGEGGGGLRGRAGAPVVEECAKGGNGLELGVGGSGGDVCEGCGLEIYGME